MSTLQFTRYEHTQRGPWGVMCYAFVAIVLLVAATVPVLALQITFSVTGLFMLLLGASIGHLTVEDLGDHLAIRFGPFPLFRKRIRYEDIVEVEKGRTNFLDGWGLHWNPRGGWIWNLWGYDCVVLHLKRGKFRVGTDDAENSVEFLEGRIAEKR